MLVRTAIWYWCNAGGLAPSPPAAHHFYKRTTETLQYIKSTIGFDKTQKKKNYLGLNELIQLIEYDVCNDNFPEEDSTNSPQMMYTPNIAVAEQQHVAWLLGYLCGIRPGSIAVSKFKSSSETLSWKDIDIRRQLTADGIWHGQFLVKITFRYLKRTEDTKVDGTDLRMTILSPNTNPMLSLPHRLLVIALRRGLLRNYKSIEELMAGKEERVTFKPDALSLPVLYATSARGLFLQNRPARSQALTEYIRSRALWLGYEGSTTFYAWRRKFGTQIERAVGVEKARGAMAHAFSSKVYEQYYDQGLYDLDNTNILIDNENGKNKAVLENTESLAVNRTIHLKNVKSRTKALNEFVENHTLVTEAVSKGTAPDDIKKIKKRLRKKALDALLRNEQEIQFQSRTIDEIHRRIKELREPSALTRMIDQRIKENERRNQKNLEPELLEQSAEDFRDVEEEMDAGEVDLQNPTDIITPDIDKCIFLPATSKTFIAFMELLLEFAPKKPSTKCSLCLASPFRTQEEKEHDWVDQTKLARHMNGREHTPYWEFRTKMIWFACEQKNKEFLCPYGCNNTYETFRTLIRHIKEYSTHDDYNHEMQKIKDGWYEENWYGDQINKQKNKPTVRKRKQHNDMENYNECYFNNNKKRKVIRLFKGYENELYNGESAGKMIRESIKIFITENHTTIQMLKGMEQYLVSKT